MLQLHNSGSVLLCVTEHTDLSKAKAWRVIEAVNVLVTVQTASGRQTAGNHSGSGTSEVTYCEDYAISSGDGLVLDV